MSAIGDYIHLHDEGYSEDLYKTQPPYISEYNSAIQERQSAFSTYLNMHSSKDRLTLERGLQKQLDLLKSFSDKDGNELIVNTSMADKALNDIWNVIVENVNFPKGISEGAFQKELAKEGIIDSNSYLKATKSYLNSNKNILRVRNLCKQTLGKINDVFIEIGKKSISQENTLKKRTEEINNSLDNIIDELKKSHFQSGYSLNTMLPSVEDIIHNNFQNLEKSINRKNFDKNASKKIKQYIQSLINNISFVYNATEYARLVSEPLGKIVGESILEAAMKTCGKEIKSSISQVVGEQKSWRGVGIGGDFFSPKYTLNSDGTTIFDTQNKKSYTINYENQDYHFITTVEKADEKVDVKIKMDEVGNRNPLIGIFGSFKNYRNVNKIPFESARLDSLIFNENYNNIVNHYLNLNTILFHLSDRKIKESYKDSVNTYMKKMILLKLVSGFNTATGFKENGTLNTMKSANVFVVIHPEKMQVKVFNISTLLMQEFVLNKFKNNRTLLPHFNPEDYIKYNHKTRQYEPKYPSAAARISNILAKLRTKTAYTLDVSKSFQ